MVCHARFSPAPLTDSYVYNHAFKVYIPSLCPHSTTLFTPLTPATPPDTTLAFAIRKSNTMDPIDLYSYVPELGFNAFAASAYGALFIAHLV
jgi:hypothetical protein